MMLVAPEIQRPLIRRNTIICQKLIAKLDKTLATKADNDAIINIFLRPYASERKPHEWDVRIIPNKKRDMRQVKVNKFEVDDFFCWNRIAKWELVVDD